MAKNLPADRVLPHVFLIHADGFCARVYLNDARGEAVLEFRS